MHHRLLLLAALLGPATPAIAQVTVDLRALDALPEAAPAAPHVVVHRPTVPRGPAARAEPAQGRSVSAVPVPAFPRQPTQAVASAAPAPAVKGAAPAQAAQAAHTVAPSPLKPPPAAAPSVAAPPAPTMDAAPPAMAQLAQIASPSPAAAPPPPPPPIEANAATTAATTSTGLRVTFAPRQSDLSPSSAEAIKQLAASAPGGGTATFNVVAYAAATPNDPSLARRLSLSRALAVRSALMADGVESSHIYVRALGSQLAGGPADRVDVTLLGGNAAPAPHQ